MRDRGFIGGIITDELEPERERERERETQTVVSRRAI